MPILDEDHRMSVAIGKTVYSHGTYPCSGIGLVWDDEDLDAALGGQVAALLFDDEGKANTKSILSDLVETDFEQDRLRGILSDPDAIENWRVGEAIAEAYLQDHRNCCFPWPDGRDERKSGSSLPGADLVGFGEDEDGDCLAFGEVKTSSQAQYPPNVMYGPKGLKKQLEDLREKELIRDGLVKYLCHRSIGAVWYPRFQAAVRRYLINSSDFQLYGLLIRDVPPNCRDLRVRVLKLSEKCPDCTTIELLALYLPEGRIKGIGKVVVEKRSGGNS